MSDDSLDVELQFTRLPGSSSTTATDGSEVSDTYELTLFDHSGSSIELQRHSIRLYPDRVIEGLEMSARKFTREFATPDGITLEDGLRFGRWLEDALFPPKISENSQGANPVRQLWDEILKRADREDRPLRLQISFPVDERGLMDDVPFELLAGKEGFYFRRTAWSVIRCFRGTDGELAEISTGARIVLLWANTPDERGDRLDATLFDEHENVIDSAGKNLGFDVIAPLRQAGVTELASLRQLVGNGSQLDILSVVAHGEPGRLWLHANDHDDFPRDPGYPVPADEVVEQLRKAGTRIAFLWSCHGARNHQVLGSLAESLLRRGRLVAVVGANVALRASTSPKLAESLFKELAEGSGGQLDRAVSAVRRALQADDLQWAAPLLYARPSRGRAVSFRLPAAPELQKGVWQVVGAPPPSPYFTGRDIAVARGVTQVLGRSLVTFTGMPGAGKSELARAVLDRIGQIADRPVENAVWLSLAGMREAAGLRARLAAMFDLREIDSDLRLARALRGRKPLIVLDNSEDLIASDAYGFGSLVQEVLQHTESVRFVLTSRRPLGDLPAGIVEHTEPVDLLEPPSDREAFLLACECRLSHDELDSEDLQALIDSLAGHPRSLMLVAGQVGYGMSLKALRERLESDTIDAITARGLIGVTPDGKDEEFRTKRLASSLNLSLEALERESPAAGEMFRWLGLLPGGMPSVLLNGVFGDRSEERLAVLLRHSLAMVAGTERRILLPAPIRWYARKKLEELEPARRGELLAASAGVWRLWLETQYEENLGAEHTRQAVRTAAEETENIESLIGEWGRQPSAGSVVDTLARTAVSWARTSQFAGQAETVLSRVDRWRDALDEFAGDSARARLLLCTGDLQVRTNRLREAEQSYADALANFRDIEERLGEANTLKALGDLQVRTNRLREAEQSYAGALANFRDIEERLGEANTLQALGDLQVRTNRLREAEQSYADAIAIFRAVEARLGEANTVRALGDLQSRTDRFRDAEQSYASALAIFRDIEARLGEAQTLLLLGMLHVRTDRLRDAEQSFTEALAICRAIEFQPGADVARKALRELDALKERMQERLQEAEPDSSSERDEHEGELEAMA